MIKGRIESIVKRILGEELKAVKSFATDASLPNYRPIEAIRKGLFQWVSVPFNGVDVWCNLRCPNATQLDQCGNISNIQVADEAGKPYTLSHDDIIKVRNYQEKICQLVFNVPTFDEIGGLIDENDFVIANKRKELLAIEEVFNANKDSMSETEKATISAQIKTLDLELGFILPDDTMAFVTSWAMGNDIGDVKKLTREQLLRAASLAKAGNNAPTDYLSGVFTDFNKNEINVYAWTILDEHQQAEAARRGGSKGVNKSAPSRRWIGGKRG